MAYQVTIERTAACPTAVVKVNTTWREFPTLWPALLDEVWAFLRSTPGIRTDGQVSRSFQRAGRVVPVRAWCAAQHRDVAGVSWEIYGDPDPRTGHFDVAVYWELS